MNYILISDSFYRKDFDIINMIRAKFPDCKLILGVKDNSLISKLKVALCYGLGHKVVKLDTDHKEQYLHDLHKVAEKYKNDKIVFVPNEEFTTDHFVDYVSKYGSGGFLFRLPSAGEYKRFRNKNDLNSYCLENNLPAPRKFDPLNTDSFDYPVILKPCIGSGSEGIIRLNCAEELTEDIKLLLKNKPFVVQELIPNGKDVHGVFALADNGNVLGIYGHKRLRTSPEEGGVTVFSKLHCDEKLMKQATEFINVSKWNGLIMLEYLYDKELGVYKLIETNPRIWGSIMLSEYSGANLLENYIHLCLGEPLVKPNLKESYIRWFFPMDIIAYIKKKGKIEGFWNFKNTCFINWTYARIDRALWFVFFSIFNTHNLSKLFRH